MSWRFTIRVVFFHEFPKVGERKSIITCTWTMYVILPYSKLLNLPWILQLTKSLTWYFSILKLRFSCFPLESLGIRSLSFHSLTFSLQFFSKIGSVVFSFNIDENKVWSVRQNLRITLSILICFRLRSNFRYLQSFEVISEKYERTLNFDI